MIIKGYQKNLIILKNIDSSIIDEAFFILKKELPEASTDGDIIKEANRIINHCKSNGMLKRKRLSFSPVNFFLGMITAGVLALLIILF